MFVVLLLPLVVVCETKSDVVAAGVISGVEVPTKSESVIEMKDNCVENTKYFFTGFFSQAIERRWIKSKV